MGHATHFLQRLQRTEILETERALELYNHPRLLQWILVFLHLPASVERLSLPLSPDPDAPRLLLTRSGDFVTVLGRGMIAQDLHTISFERFQVLRSKALERLDEVERALLQTQGQTEFERVQTRLSRAGRCFGREDLKCLIAFHPLLRLSHLQAHFQAFDLVLKCKETLLSKELRRKAEPKDLRNIWALQYSLEHHLVLLCHEGPKSFDFLLDHLDTLSLPNVHSVEDFWLEIRSTFWATFRQGCFSNACRTLWAIGKIGKPLLPALKAALSLDSSLLFSMATLGLVCIALRHRKLREEIIKFLFAPSWLEDPRFINFHRKMEPPWFELFTKLLLDPSSLEHGALHATRNNLFNDLPRLAERFPTPEDLPKQIAFPLFLSLPIDFIHRRANLQLVLLLLPWLARVEAEELYLPNEFLSFVPPWEPEETLFHVDCWKAYLREKAPPPASSSRQTGVNEPCPCGSGRKFKRCCLRSPSSPPPEPPPPPQPPRKLLDDLRGPFNRLRDSILLSLRSSDNAPRDDRENPAPSSPPLDPHERKPKPSP